MTDPQPQPQPQPQPRPQSQIHIEMPTGLAWDDDAASFGGSGVSLAGTIAGIAQDSFGRAVGRFVAPTVRRTTGGSGGFRVDWRLNNNNTLFTRANFGTQPSAWTAWYARARAQRRIEWLVEALATDDFEPIWGVRFRPAQPVPTEWVARDRERRIPLGELWQEIIGRTEGYRPLPPARVELARTTR